MLKREVLLRSLGIRTERLEGESNQKVKEEPASSETMHELNQEMIEAIENYLVGIYNTKSVDGKGYLKVKFEFTG